TARIWFLRGAHRGQSRQDDQVVADGSARADRGGSRRRHHSSRHHPVPGADEAEVAERAAWRAGGGGYRRADQACRDARVAWSQAESPALAEGKLAAAMIDL